MPDFVQGLTMGRAYVAPSGVQNLFVVHSALAHPRRRALATAGIVIFFDVTLALACFFGVGVVMETFPVVRMAVLLAGSLVVLAIGVGLLRTKEAGAEGRPLPATGAKTVSTAFVVTWCNPQALIDGTIDVYKRQEQRRPPQKGRKLPRRPPPARKRQKSPRVRNNFPWGGHTVL